MNPLQDPPSPARSSRARDLAAPLILLAVVIAFFWKLLLTNQYSWLQSPDLAWQILPWFQYEALQFHHHVFPLWDPFQYAGQTLIGQANPGLAFPLNWLLFSLPLRDGHINVRYLNWYFMSIHYFGALFCYWLCRDLNRSRLASLLGGLSFGLGGFVGTTDWPEILNGAIWCPLVFLFLFRALRGARPRASAALCGLFLGISWLSGHHVVPLFTSLAVLGVWIFSAFERGREAKHLLAPAALFLLFTALAGAFQMWPTFAYGRNAVRWVGSQHDPIAWNQTVPYTVHKLYSLGPRFLLGILIPGWDDGVSPYVGVVALALVALALARFWQVKEVRLLFATGIAGLFFALGNNDLFHGILYSVVPIVEKAREPSMALSLFHFAIAPLAAFGMDALLFAPSRSVLRRLVFVTLGFGAAAFLIVFAVFMNNGQKWTGDDRVMMTVLSAFALSGLVYRLGAAPAARRGIPLLVVALYLVELGNSSMYYLPNKEEGARNIYLSRLDETSQVAGFLRRQPQPVRVWANKEDVPFNFGDWYGIDSLNGYTPGMPLNFFEIEAHSLRGRRIFASAYTISRQPLFPDQKEVFRASNGLAVYANPDVLPRVRTVHDAVQVRNPDDARRHLQDAAFDLGTRTFGYSPPPAMDRCDGDTIGKTTRGIDSTITVVTMKCRGMVVMSENDAPGWVAFVDGVKTPVYDAYTTLRGVVVAAGTHTVEMRYQPFSVRAGALATLLAFLAAPGLWFASRAPRRRPAESANPRSRRE